MFCNLITNFELKGSRHREICNNGEVAIKRVDYVNLTEGSQQLDRL